MVIPFYVKFDVYLDTFEKFEGFVAFVLFLKNCLMIRYMSEINSYFQA